MKKLLLTLALVGIAIAPLALGASSTIGTPEPKTTTALDIPNVDFITWVNNVANIVFSFLLIGAVIFILVAGYNMATSASDPKKVDEAKRIIFWAVIGIIVSGLAYGLVKWLANKMGGTL
jgi:large-conductance mechanosensitive channel